MVAPIASRSASKAVRRSRWARLGLSSNASTAFVMAPLTLPSRFLVRASVGRRAAQCARHSMILPDVFGDQFRLSQIVLDPSKDQGLDRVAGHRAPVVA